MANQIIPRTASNRNSSRPSREEALRIAIERATALRAAENGIIHSTVYQTTDPGPDFTPRSWR